METNALIPNMYITEYCKKISLTIILLIFQLSICKKICPSISLFLPTLNFALADIKPHNIVIILPLLLFNCYPNKF